MVGTVTGILAGYDGSPSGEQALAWAAAEARIRSVELIVCHAWRAGYPVPPGDSAEAGTAPQHSEQILADGLQRAGAAMPDGAVRPLLACGPAARVLCEHSREAAMVVVGCRGRGGMAGLLLGSVSSQVAAQASGPVTVVRGQARPVPGGQPGPIVVGADGSQACEAAVAFAFAEAALRGVALHAVCALADAAGVLGCARQIEEDFGKMLAIFEPDYPGVRVRRLVVQGAPRRALLEAAEQARAQMLVVGARGRGGLPGMTLGSVSLALLHHAPCPVSVIHPR